MLEGDASPKKITVDLSWAVQQSVTTDWRVEAAEVRVQRAVTAAHHRSPRPRRHHPVTPLVADGRTVGALYRHSRQLDAFDTDALAVGELLTAHASLAVAAAADHVSSRDLAEQMRQALDSRAVIEQAKGVLMASTGQDTEGALAALVERSQRSDVKLREVA